MATLTIRNLPENVRALLRVNAARNGRSMEAEARHILTDALGAPLDAADELGRWKALQTLVRKHANPADIQKDQVGEFLRGKRRDAIAEMVDDGLDVRAVLGANFRRALKAAGLTAGEVDAMRWRKKIANR